MKTPWKGARQGTLLNEVATGATWRLEVLDAQSRNGRAQVGLRRKCTRGWADYLQMFDADHAAKWFNKKGSVE